MRPSTLQRTPNGAAELGARCVPDSTACASSTDAQSQALRAVPREQGQPGIEPGRSLAGAAGELALGEFT